MSLWDPSAGKLNSVNSLDFLNRNLGYSLQSGRDKKTLQALTAPTTFIEERDAKIGEIIKAKVLPYFEARYKELIDLGLPDERAKVIATEQANRMYTDQLEILELSQPNAYEKVFNIGALKHDTIMAEASIVTAKKQAVREYKQKKRAPNK